jgi:spore maturation protein SpmA
MRIGEQGGVITLFSRLLGPLFSKLFPDIPKGHPVTGSIFMNLAANMLGLDNAATPLGLKAMEGLQELNPKKDTASNPMIMFLVLNTSGLTLIPISIMVYRAQLGATQPTDIFVPILLATFFSTLAGIVAVSIYQRINLFNRTILLFLGGMSLLVAGILAGDILVKIGDCEIKEVYRYMDCLAKLSVGDEKDVTIMRNGKPITVKVKF